jgi:hypothetical protein
LQFLLFLPIQGILIQDDDTSRIYPFATPFVFRGRSSVRQQYQLATVA